MPCQWREHRQPFDRQRPRKVGDLSPLKYLIRAAAAFPVGALSPGRSFEQAGSHDVVDPGLAGEPAPRTKAGDSPTELGLASHGVGRVRGIWPKVFVKAKASVENGGSDRHVRPV